MSFVMLMCLGLAMASRIDNDPQCNIGWLSDNQKQTHDFIEGFFYGLSAEPDEKVDTCWNCNQMGYTFSALEATVTSLINDGRNWSDENYIRSLVFFEQVRVLLSLFFKFYAFGYNLDRLWNWEVFQNLLEVLKERLAGDLYVEVRNLVE